MDTVRALLVVTYLTQVFPTFTQPTAARVLPEAEGTLQAAPLLLATLRRCLQARCARAGRTAPFVHHVAAVTRRALVGGAGRVGPTLACVAAACVAYKAVAARLEAGDVLTACRLTVACRAAVGVQQGARGARLALHGRALGGQRPASAHVAPAVVR